MQIADFLRASLPYIHESTIDRAGHLLQIQQPELVAREIAQFLGRNALGRDHAEHANQNTALRA